MEKKNIIILKIIKPYFNAEARGVSLGRHIVFTENQLKKQEKNNHLPHHCCTDHSHLTRNSIYPTASVKHKSIQYIQHWSKNILRYH